MRCRIVILALATASWATPPPAVAYRPVLTHVASVGSFTISPGLSLTPRHQYWQHSITLYGSVLGEGAVDNEESTSYQYEGPLGSYNFTGQTPGWSPGETLLTGWGELDLPSPQAFFGSGVVSVKTGTGASYVVAGPGTISANIYYGQYLHDASEICFILGVSNLQIDPDGPGGSSPVQIGEDAFNTCGGWVPTEGPVASPVTAGSFATGWTWPHFPV